MGGVVPCDKWTAMCLFSLQVRFYIQKSASNLLYPDYVLNIFSLENAVFALELLLCRVVYCFTDLGPRPLSMEVNTEFSGCAE